MRPRVKLNPSSFAGTMTSSLLPDDSAVVMQRLSPDLIELMLDRIASAIRREPRAAGAAVVRRLRALIDRSMPAQPTAAKLGALPEILGTTVTLQYPLIQLEQFLSGEPSDILDADQAELYLSFVRYHLWKLEHILRELSSA